MRVFKTCRFCGERFLAPTRGRMYCSTPCRRHYQDERRKDERAEERERRESCKFKMQDPWAGEAYLGDDVWGNALLDGWADSANYLDEYPL